MTFPVNYLILLAFQDWNGWDEDEAEMDFIRDPIGRWCYQNCSTAIACRPLTVPSLFPALRPELPSSKEENSCWTTRFSLTQCDWSIAEKHWFRSSADKSTWASSRWWFCRRFFFILQHHFHLHLPDHVFGDSFLAWQCLERMTRSLPRPMAVPRFQTSRMLWSLMRPFAFLWSQQAALEDVSTQTEVDVIKLFTFWTAEFRCCNSRWMTKTKESKILTVWFTTRARCDINLFVCEPNWSTIPFASLLPSAFTSESSRHTRFEMLQPMHSDVAWQEQSGWTVVNFSFFSTGVRLVPPNWSIHHFARLEPPHAAAAPHWAFSTRPLWLLRVLPPDNDSRGPFFKPSNRSYAWQNR